MPNTSTFALYTGVAALLGGIPLWLRWVPQNSLFGARFAEAYKSDEAWYRINAYAGKLFVAFGAICLLVGVGIRTMISSSSAIQTNRLMQMVILLPLWFVARLCKKFAKENVS